MVAVLALVIGVTEVACAEDPITTAVLKANGMTSNEIQIRKNRIFEFYRYFQIALRWAGD